MISPFVPPIFSAPAPVVTLSGETTVDNISGGTKIAGIIFRADGTVDSVIGVTIAQIDAATDWIIPPGLADSSYEVRFVSLTGDAWTTAAAVENTWIDLGADRRWDVQESSGGITSNNVTFEIRKDGGAALDTGFYTHTADDT